MQHILGQMLLENGITDSTLELRIVDGAVVAGPGSKGTDWVVHTLIDPVAGTFESVEITDSRGGETLMRHTFKPGSLVLGDRQYATARGIHFVVSGEAFPMVRVNRRTLKICDPKKRRIYLQNFEADIPKEKYIALDVLIPIPMDTVRKNQAWDIKNAKAWIPARNVGYRTAKDVIWVLTTASREQLSDEDLLNLYRLRWQVELLFKRLKSLLHLDTLPSKDGPTSKTRLLIRLAAAAIAQVLVSPSGFFSPGRHQGPRMPANSQRVVPISRSALGA
jgi:hypothetical protein